MTDFWLFLGFFIGLGIVLYTVLAIRLTQRIYTVGKTHWERDLQRLMLDFYRESDNAIRELERRTTEMRNLLAFAREIGLSPDLKRQLERWEQAQNAGFVHADPVGEPRSIHKATKPSPRKNSVAAKVVAAEPKIEPIPASFSNLGKLNESRPRTVSPVPAEPTEASLTPQTLDYREILAEIKDDYSPGTRVGAQTAAQFDRPEGERDRRGSITAAKPNPGPATEALAATNTPSPSALVRILGSIGKITRTTFLEDADDKKLREPLGSGTANSKGAALAEENPGATALPWIVAPSVSGRGEGTKVATSTAAAGDGSGEKRLVRSSADPRLARQLERVVKIKDNFIFPDEAQTPNELKKAVDEILAESGEFAQTPSLGALRDAPDDSLILPWAKPSAPEGLPEDSIERVWALASAGYSAERIADELGRSIEEINFQLRVAVERPKLAARSNRARK